MFEILKAVQADLGDLKRDVGDLKRDVGELKRDVGELKSRMTTVDAVLRKMRRDNAGMLVMMRATAGHFEERVSDLEIKMDNIERPRG